MLLRQAFCNLCRNALEACAAPRSRRASPFTARCWPATQTVAVTVTDNGPASARGRRDRLFRPFFTTRADGTGLGLALVQKFVVTHNGRTSAPVTAPTGGAVFTIDLPLRPGGPAQSCRIRHRAPPSAPQLLHRRRRCRLRGSTCGRDSRAAPRTAACSAWLRAVARRPGGAGGGSDLAARGTGGFTVVEALIALGIIAQRRARHGRVGAADYRGRRRARGSAPSPHSLPTAASPNSPPVASPARARAACLRTWPVASSTATPAASRWRSAWRLRAACRYAAAVAGSPAPATILTVCAVAEPERAPGTRPAGLRDAGADGSRGHDPSARGRRGSRPVCAGPWASRWSNCSSRSRSPASAWARWR